MERTDCIVVGQGLAGTALVWALAARGLDVRVFDPGSTANASQVAAGLITPVLGRRFAPASGFDVCRALATDHYRDVERRTQRRCFDEREALRVVLDEAERARLDARRAALGGRIGAPGTPPAAGIARGLETLALPAAARLDTRAYLTASRAEFDARGWLRAQRLNPDAVEADEDGVRVAEHGLRARYLVFCGGAADARNPWLPPGCLSPAKGEVLTVTVRDLSEARTVHGPGGWLIPAQRSGHYRFGATYDHDDMSAAITPAARATLCERLARLVVGPFEVVDQQAAVRPVGVGRRPVLGRHGEVPAIAWLNGLGSRGALWAPWLARALVQFLLDARTPQLPMCRPADGDSA